MSTRTVGGSPLEPGDQGIDSAFPTIDFAPASHTHGWLAESEALTLAGTWVNIGLGWVPAGIFKFGNVVCLEGYIKQTGADALICTVPDHFLPRAELLPMYFVAGCWDGTYNGALLQLNASGQLNVLNAPKGVFDLTDLSRVKYVFQ